MRIRWDEIPAGGLFFRVEDRSWIPSDVLVGQGQVVCEVSLRKERARVLLEGSLRLPLVLECDRCLASFPYLLSEEFEVFFELTVKEDSAEIAPDYFCKGDDLDVVSVVEPVVDIFAVLAQQVYLALPEKKICRSGCLGLCPDCGINLNTRSCGCVRESKASPFGILLKLKDPESL